MYISLINIPYPILGRLKECVRFTLVNDNIITINEILNEKQQRVVTVKLLGFIKLYPKLKNFSLTMHETNKETEEELNKFAKEYLKHKDVK